MPVIPQEISQVAVSRELHDHVQRTYTHVLGWVI